MGVYLIPVGLYLLACCLPALDFSRTNQSNDVMFGLRALVVGWSGLFAGVFGWYANPFWFLGVVFLGLRKPIVAAVFGILAAAIAFTVYSDIGRVLPGDEGNVTHTSIVRLLPGFYVWIASLVAVPICAPFLTKK